jgi:hypothetical protein
VGFHEFELAGVWIVDADVVLEETFGAAVVLFSSGVV